MMFRKLFASFCALCALTLFLQKAEAAATEDKLPEIFYATPREYKIADIAVTGMDNYEDYVLIGLSNLSVGQVIKVPGDEITEALKRYWKHGLFSDVKIVASKIQGSQIWLEIQLKPRPQISAVKYNGIKKSDKDDLENSIGLTVGNQISPNIADKAKVLIKRHYDEKGFKNAEVDIIQKEDPTDKTKVIVEVNIDRKDKIKVNQIIFDGNVAFTDSKAARAMKKTKQKGKIENFFSSKKFVEAEYEKDKALLIQKYNEFGYRDARILEDTVYKFDDKSVNVYLKIDEGKRYFFRNIDWVGNTVYSASDLNRQLQITKGDVYNQKRLDERLKTSQAEDAVSNMYMDNGYLFFQVDPVEVRVEGDSIDLEMRIHEDRQATINRINISGNDRLYENVIRRELRIKPGALFNKSALMRSAREIQQMGHFDPEKMGLDPVPDYEAGTVDINLNLTPKNNDQIEFSAGWGSTGIVGSVSLKFTNFSIRNLLNLGTYKVLPQGDGETFSITGRSNGNYYSSYSFSFLEPWLGGKRPNSFSFSGYYSHQSDVSSRYYSNYSNMYNNYNYYSGYGGYGGYGSNYGGNGYGGNSSYMYELDPDKYLKMWGLSMGLGGRLTWPDDYFQLYGELSYQHYSLQNWSYFVISNGRSNDLSLSLTLSRKSIDNPLYPRFGSDFTLSAQSTLPYSLFGKYTTADYKQMVEKKESEKLYKWIEYYKIKLKSKTYTPLSANRKLVLMTRFDMGYLGSFNEYKLSPFGMFYLGGDGTTGYSSTYTYETMALRGYENGALGTNYIYERLGMELRYPLMMETSTTIYGLAFVEAGNGWSKPKLWSPFDLKRSAGVGVRIFLPMVGLMGIDWAYGFDKVPGSSKPSGSQFHFIIGQEF
ncbi:MAG TPA: POTRA domain-containing protein [Bacteroidales bacterium]|nr:POTRA domain-containing protein [Bacteroidales bacterium]